AMKEENFTDNINNYRSAIFFELESTKFPNYGYKMYSQTWEDVAGAIYRYDDFGGEIDEDRVFRKEVDVLIESHKGKPELAGAIFNFVKSKMVWNGYYGVGCENGIKNAFEKGKGNVADINLMLTSMLRYAGFNANPVLVSTKDHGIPLFPTMDGFNYVIAAIELEQGYLLLDATENILGINQLPVRAINWSGRLVREDGTSKSVSLIPEQISEKNIFMNVEFQEDGKVDGKMQTRFTNHLAYEYRKEVGSKTKEQLKDYISAIYDGTEIEKLENENLKNSNAQLTETLEFTKDGVMEIIGDRAYFSPMLFLANKENPFKMEKREYPIDLDYSKKEKVTINFSIPSGFAIESIPESMALGLPDDQGTFNYTIRQNGSNIQLVCIKETKSAMLSPILYEPLREFYEQVVQKENDKVVLVKTKS
ncbi:MAG: transglutaminase, partial [Maribacter sp.]